MSSKTVTTHNAKDANRRPFCVGWGTGVPSVAPHTEGVAELGSHSSRKPKGAGSREARRRILAVGEYPSTNMIETFIESLFYLYGFLSSVNPKI